MDPQTAWNDLVDARMQGDALAAAFAAASLIRWIERGGFPPQVIPGRPLDPEWNAAIALAACRFVLGSTGMSDSL